tara:strand:- start:638 stop:1468 length:831 start_codon:yes stop_codon:yes gene_type:complete
VKKFNVGLVGYGKMGKIYIKEINKNKNFRVIEILRHKNSKKETNIIKKFFNSKKINLFIISSPIRTHFKYLKYAYEAKKNIIVEKPLVENLSQLNKLIKINKNFSKKIMIHHNDVLNFEKLKIAKKINNNDNIKRVEMSYGKNEIINKYKDPFIDWLPHPLSIIVNFFNKIKKFKILNYSRGLKKKIIKEKLRIVFDLQNFKIFVNFSNNFNSPQKKIIIYKKNQNLFYDGYEKQNQKSVKLLLKKFNKISRINDVNSNVKVYELLFKIKKLLKKR